MTDEIERFEKVRLLTRLGPDACYSGGELGYLELSEQGLAFWGQFSGARVEIPVAQVEAAQGMGLRTARTQVVETGIQLDGIEPNFWTACPDGGSFLILRLADSTTAVFHLRGVPAPRLQVALKERMPLEPATPAVTEPANATISPTLAMRDLGGLSARQRQGVTAQLVAQGIAHSWSDQSLSVAPESASALDRLLDDVSDAPPSSPRLEPAGAAEPSPLVDAASDEAGSAKRRTWHRSPSDDAGTEEARPEQALHTITEHLQVLERLIAIRDAGGLTDEEYETARASVARQLINHDG